MAALQPIPTPLRSARSLAVDGDELEHVLLRLRRDTAGQKIRWRLGDHGACEIDATFVPLPCGTDVDVAPSYWAAGARLWNRTDLAVAPVAFVIAPTPDGGCVMEVRPGALAPYWEHRGPTFAALARAALDELAEELLWHASSLRRDVL